MCSHKQKLVNNNELLNIPMTQTFENKVETCLIKVNQSTMPGVSANKRTIRNSNEVQQGGPGHG